MKTVILASIEGHNVIVGFGVPCIDPVATRRVVDVAVRETGEYQTVAESLRTAAGLQKRIMDLKLEGKQVRGNKTRSGQVDEEYRAALGESQTLQERLRGEGINLKAASKRLMGERAIYCSPRAGEYLIEDSEALRLSEALRAAILAWRSVIYDPATGQVREIEMERDRRARVEYEAMEARQAALKAAQEAQ